MYCTTMSADDTPERMMADDDERFVEMLAEAVRRARAEDRRRSRRTTEIDRRRRALRIHPDHPGWSAL